MSRLSLVISDKDMEYLTKLEKYLIVNYPQRFDIFSFSSPDKLYGFIKAADKKDILLIGTNIYNEKFDYEKFNAVMLLSGDSPHFEHTDYISNDYVRIQKYQHAEKLVADILGNYSKTSKKSDEFDGRLNAGKGFYGTFSGTFSGARIICIFSPSGGSGKSSIAAGLSILCARKGLKTFYLNLENVPTTRLYFSSEQGQNFSNVIYHLKGRENNIRLKLESLKCCDSKTGVHFFPPPESMLEMEELVKDDILRLLSDFKSFSGYDAVFIDMSCGLNQCNTALLSCADAVVMIFLPDMASDVKGKEIYSGFDMLKNKYDINIPGRIITVVNRDNDGGIKGSNARTNTDACSYIADEGYVAADARIGEYTKQISGACNGELIENISFMSDLNKLLGSVLQNDICSAPGTSLSDNRSEFIA